MAELADALDSGSSESNFMQVQFLLPAPKRKSRLLAAFFLLYSSPYFSLLGMQSISNCIIIFSLNTINKYAKLLNVSMSLSQSKRK